MAEVTELVTKFSFVGSTQPLNDFNAKLGKSIAALGAMAAAVGAAAAGVAGFVQSTTAALDPMVQLSRETGVAVGTIQSLGFAASQTGSSAEALQSSLTGLSQRLGEAANGTGEGVDVFKRLGIELRNSQGQVRDVDAVLNDLRRNMDGLSSAERISVANKLGIDPSLVQLLSTTDDQMSALTDRARELGVVTTEQADAAAAFNDSLTVLQFAMDGIRNNIAVGFAPELQKLSEGFTDFLARNRELIQDGLSKVAEGIMVLAEGFVRLLPVLGLAAGAFTVIWGVTGGFAAVLAALTSPIALIIGGVALIALAIDDLIVAFQGGDSVIKDFFQNFFGIDITPILRDIVAAFKEMVGGIMEAFSSLGDAIGSVFDAVVALINGDFEGFISNMFEAFQSWFDFILSGWTSVLSFFGDLIDAVVPGLVDNIQDFFQGLFDWLFAKIEAVVGAFRAVGDFLGFGDEEPVPGAAPSTVSGPAGELMLPPGSDRLSIGGSTTSSSTTNNAVNQDVNINVSSNDPAAAANAVRDRLNEQMRDAQTQFNRGGR